MEKQLDAKKKSCGSLRKKMGALISDIAMATLRARQHNGVVRRFAKGPRAKCSARCRNEYTQWSLNARDLQTDRRKKEYYTVKPLY